MPRPTLRITDRDQQGADRMDEEPRAERNVQSETQLEHLRPPAPKEHSLDAALRPARILQLHSRRAVIPQPAKAQDDLYVNSPRTIRSWWEERDSYLATNGQDPRGQVSTWSKGTNRTERERGSAREIDPHMRRGPDAIVAASFQMPVAEQDAQLRADGDVLRGSDRQAAGIQAKQNGRDTPVQIFLLG